MLHFREFMASSGLANFIMSIQQIEITMSSVQTSNTATISSVDTSRTIIMYDGVTTSANSSTESVVSRAEITNATTVTAYRNSTNSVAVTIRFSVVQFSPRIIDSVQTGTIVLNGAFSNTATISSVDTSRAVAFFQGLVSTINTVDRAFADIALTNSTTVTASKGDDVDNTTVAYCVVEFASDVVKSVQQVQISLNDPNTSLSATITAVNPSLTLLLFQGNSITASRNPDILYPLVYLNSSTQVIAERASTDSAVVTKVRVAVVEFRWHVIKSIQRGQSTIASSNTTNDVTITSVHTSKTFVSFLGFTTTLTSHTEDRYFASSKLHNATTVRLQRNTSDTATVKVSWEVVEFR